MTLQNVANSFMGYYPKFTINKRKLTFKEANPQKSYNMFFIKVAN